MSSRRIAASAYVVLSRAFFAQFFTNESVTSDIQLRQTIIWVLAFLLTPGLLLLLMVFPQYQYVVLRAAVLHAPEMVDDMVEWLVFLFTTYSMVSVGLIAAFLWDSLAFDRRDAQVLGPLPLGAATVIAAKLTALAALLLTASTAVNLLNAVLFAIQTADRFGAAIMLEHFVAHLIATVSAATCVLCAVVTVRATVAVFDSARLTTVVGSLFQFMFVIALLSVVVLSPAVRHDVPLLTNRVTESLPSAWFLGLFGWIRGSSRAYVHPLAARAITATLLTIVTAIVTSILGFVRQWRFALSPATDESASGAVVSRAIARRLTYDDVARATSEFVLVTIARNRAQRIPIVMNAAVGVAIAIAALSRGARGLTTLFYPRTAVLWIPLVLAYWMTIGLRASFFVPSHLQASWTFSANGWQSTYQYWAGVRAAMIGFVLPPTLALVVMIGPIVGWPLATWHGVVVTSLTILLIEMMALTIDFVPFTRPYRPGHAKLRTRWVLYAAGFFVFAYWPARFVLTMRDDHTALLVLAGLLVGAIGVCEIVGRRRGLAWKVEPHEHDEQLSEVTVLGLDAYQLGSVGSG